VAPAIGKGSGLLAGGGRLRYSGGGVEVGGLLKMTLSHQEEVTREEGERLQLRDSIVNRVNDLHQTSGGGGIPLPASVRGSPIAMRNGHVHLLTRKKGWQPRKRK